MNALNKIAIFFAVISFMGWTAYPKTCSAHDYYYQAPTVQVYDYGLLPYPNHYYYSSPVSAPGGFYYVSPSPTCKYKYKHKHKHHHKYKHKYKKHWD